jgi:Putative Ig domain
MFPASRSAISLDMWQLQPGVLSRAAIDAASLVLGISGTPVTTATKGVAYAGFTVTASGGTPAYTYSIASGALPSGITLNASSGAVSGTPTIYGSYPGIVIRVTDAASATANLASFTITVLNPVLYAMLPDVFVNSGGTQRQANAGGTMVNL